MKDFIVLIATIILGVVLAGLIIGLGDKGEDMSNAAGSKIDAFLKE